MKKRWGMAAALALALAAVPAAVMPARAGWIWEKDAGWLYENQEKALCRGWNMIDKAWYYFGQDGVMETGWLKEGDRWYFLLADGRMAVGWLWVDGNWYYLRADGSMATGWIDTAEGWYYMDTLSGAMLKDTVTPDGYVVGADGSWISGETAGSVRNARGRGGGGSGGKSHGSSSGNNGASSGSGGREDKIPAENDGGNGDSGLPDMNPGSGDGNENQGDSGGGDLARPERPQTPPETEPDSEDRPCATPSEADRDEETAAKRRLAEYREQGLWLEENDQKRIEEYIEPALLRQERRLIVIGEDFYPYSYKLNQHLYPMVENFSTRSEEIAAEGHVYRIVIWNLTYAHTHELTGDTAEPTCTLDGLRVTLCSGCDYREETVIPALGHADCDGDFVCDRCDAVMPFFKVGDHQTVTTGLGGDFGTMTFTCLDDCYKGGMLFLADQVIPCRLSSPFDAESNDYTWSELRKWLNYSFADGLSVADNLLPVMLGETEDGICDRVFCLSKAEIQSEPYRKTAMRPWDFGAESRYYWTRSADPDWENYAFFVQYNGHIGSSEVDRVEAGVRPAYVLRNPSAASPEPGRWMEKDVQERRIAGKDYIFRCIDPDYSDSTGNHIGALFLCDSIIGGDQQVFDKEEGCWETSELRQWLAENLENKTGITPADTTLYRSYLGWSEYYDEAVDMDMFTGSPAAAEPTKDLLFCLSLEEAVRYKDYLWRLKGSGDNNYTSGGSYTSGYWLRSQETSEAGRAYCVTYEGRITPAETNRERIGIRPAYVVPQE